MSRICSGLEHRQSAQRSSLGQARVWGDRLLEELVQFHLTFRKVPGTWNSTQNCCHKLHPHCPKDYRLAESSLWAFTQKNLKLAASSILMGAPGWTLRGPVRVQKHLWLSARSCHPLLFFAGDLNLAMAQGSQYSGMCCSKGFLFLCKHKPHLLNLSKRIM